MSVVASAPGKLVLLGEYAVVDGAPGLVAAVDRRVSVSLRQAEQMTVLAPDIGITRMPLAQGQGAEGDPLALVRHCVDIVSDLVGRPLPPVAITIESAGLSDGPGGAKLGLGSSAAVASACVGALLVHSAHTVDAAALGAQVFELALTAHRRAQGELGSGIDVAAASFGGILRYERRTESGAAAHWQLGRPEWLRPICVWTGRSASTRERLQAVARFAQRDRHAYRRLIDSLSAAAEEGCDAVAADDPQRFFDAVAAFGDGMRLLGEAADVDIVSEVHRRAGAILGDSGGVYKPSGAGGGDLGVGFVKTPHAAAAAVSALERSGFATVPLGLGGAGVEVRQEA